MVDSICVGQHRQPKDLNERVFIFVKLTSTQKGLFSSHLGPRIRQAISEELSRRHVPQFIIEVTTIPYNANGKKMEVQLKSCP